MQLEVTGRWFQAKDDTYVSLPLVNRSVDLGEARQLLCTEMIHWDDYRRDRSINDGKPPMQQLFASERDEVPLHIFTSGADTFASQVIGVDPTQSGSPVQMFCSEMQHWDDYCAQRGITTGTSTMRALYRSFERKEFAVLDTNEQKLKFYGGDSVALISYGGDKQTYCSEMEHWDDFVKAKTGQLPQPSMASLFRQQ